MGDKVEGLAGVLERAGYGRAEAYALAVALATPGGVADDAVDLGREYPPGEDTVARHWSQWYTPTAALKP